MIVLIILQAFLSMALPLNKHLLAYCPPFFLVGSRLLMGGSFILLYYLLYAKKLVLCRKHSFAYVQMIVIGVYFKHMLRSWSLQYMSAVKMACMFNGTPFIAAILSFLLHGERVSYKQLLGILLGILGLVPLLWIRLENGNQANDVWYTLLPDLALLLAMVAHCYGMLIARTLIRDKQQSASLTNGIRMFGGGFLCLLSAFWVEGLFPVKKPLPLALGLLFLVISTNIVCHGWYLRLLQTHSVTVLALSDFLEPLFTACYGWLFMHEVLSWHYPYAILLVCIGLYLVYQEEQCFLQG